MMRAQLGQRAELRPLLPHHATELAECVASARAHLAPWTVIASRVTDAASATELLKHYADPPRYFGIWLANELVGATLFRALDIPSARCELGAWLAPAVEGRGLVTTAFRRMIDYAVREYGMTRIELHVSPENTRGRALALRLGMTVDRVVREAVTINAMQHDSEIWAIDVRDRQSRAA